MGEDVSANWRIILQTVYAHREKIPLLLKAGMGMEMLRQINRGHDMASFKSGERDSMEVWTPNPDHPVRVLYLAVRDEDGTYLGTAELVEDFTAVRERFLGER